MTYQALLCAITAHNGRNFILSTDEVNRLVVDYGAHALLDDPDLFREAVHRFLKDQLPHPAVIRRLVAIFGRKRLLAHTGRLDCTAVR